MLVETEQDSPVGDGGPRRRRSWTEAEKRRIVAESRQPGISVSTVARRHDVNANLVFTWRRQFRDQDPGDKVAGSFVPVVLPGDAMAGGKLAPVAERSAPRDEVAAMSEEPIGRIEIVLAGGRRVIVDKMVNASALARVIGVLERR